ncbi:myeloid differentiation primary response protein MyD88-like [Teleopsis dalmanni]|uniref:myeloid differentiation primary response protein MyD88-like n=1 Tax=Teleopsis dalmanni TaxID=139649 RepID=UPI0018CD9D9A|nr:myeloid differentiation primary response protein MyD88-like [Teleopsis dalmanni]
MVQNLAVVIPPVNLNAASSLDSAASEGSESSFNDIPLTALSKNTRKQLSNSLNSKKVLRSEEGYERDWRGIAMLTQQKNFCDENALSGGDPMSKVLQLWCSNSPKTATFANLERFLGRIDRWDVSDDIYENLAEDARNYNTKLQQKSLVLNDEPDAVQPLESNDNFGFGSDPNILTKDDVLRAQKGLPPQKYDAFVLFADADINYAIEMLAKLEENEENNFKLCLKDRDLLAGVSFTHVALTQLIEERCKHLIVILTDEFIKSPENKFLVNYTQALQIQNKTRKIIPLLYDDKVVIPRTLKIYTHLRYNGNTNGLFNFWSKLASSIRNVQMPTNATSSYAKEFISCSLPKSFETKIPTLPTPPTEIPSININGNAFVPEDDIPKKKERFKYKKRSSIHNTDHKLLVSDPKLRNAHSTSQLSAVSRDGSSSMSNLSITSSPCDTKKKKKWPSKLFKKVFSRSTSKLQEPA